MKERVTAIAYSLNDFRILPGYTHQNCNLSDVSLKSRLCRKRDGFIFLELPFISAAMHAVTSVEIATALAKFGGAGVIPLYKSINEQCEKVKIVKQYKEKKYTHATPSPIRTATHCRRSRKTAIGGRRGRDIHRSQPQALRAAAAVYFETSL